MIPRSKSPCSSNNRDLHDHEEMSRRARKPPHCSQSTPSADSTARQCNATSFKHLVLSNFSLEDSHNIRAADMRGPTLRHALSAAARSSTRRLDSAGKSTRISLPIITRPVTTRSNASNTRSGYVPRTLAIGITAGLAGLLALAQLGRTALAEAPPNDNNEDAETRLFRLDEINHHNRESKGYWVYRGDRVYDITDWVPNHPGGDVILRAVGGSVEPYWLVMRLLRTLSVFRRKASR